MIKVDKQLPVVTALDPQARRPVQGEQTALRTRKAAPAAEPAATPRGKSTSFNLQLNQQLTSMQAADSYLGELAGRLEALSHGRYQGAALGADLETEGVVTPQGVQQLDRFSEGVKEQIATLLRVSVAEHLGTMLVLDDHLAQTDPGRAEWFRKLLRESAQAIQVVVLTCRPGDYLGEGGDGVHVVDLSSAVDRS